MIGEVIIGNSFGNWCHYAINEEKSAAVLVAVGVRPWSAEEMTTDFVAQQALRPSLKQATMHVALAWPGVEKDRLSDELMTELATEYLGRYLAKVNKLNEADAKKEAAKQAQLAADTESGQAGPEHKSKVAGKKWPVLTLEDVQWAVVRHHDRDHPHCHLMVNRVTNHGDVIRDSHSYQLSAEVCRELEQEYRLLDAARKGREERLRELRETAEPTQPAFKQAWVYINEAAHRQAEQVASVPDLARALANEPVPITLHCTYEEDKLKTVVFERAGQFVKGGLLSPPLSGEKLAELLTRQHEQLAAAEALAETAAATWEQLRQQASVVLAALLPPDLVPPLANEQDYWRRVQEQGYSLQQPAGREPWQLRHEASSECFTLAEVRPGGPDAPSVTVQLNNRLQAQGLAEVTAKLKDLLAAQNFTTIEECQALVRQGGYQPKRDDHGGYFLHEATQRRFPAAEVQLNGRNFEEQVLEVVGRRQAELVHGSISVLDNDNRSATERIEAIQRELVKAGATVNPVKRTLTDLGELRLVLEYAHMIKGPRLDDVNEVLDRVQTSTRITVVEQSTEYGQPAQEWPRRNGQFGQATITVTASQTRDADAPARAALISAALQQAGASVQQTAGEQSGQVQLQVHYHTRRHDLGQITATLDKVSASKGLEVRETDLTWLARGGQVPTARQQQTTTQGRPTTTNELERD